MPTIRAELDRTSITSKVFLDDQDISSILQGIHVHCAVPNITTVQMTLIPKRVVFTANDPVMIYEGVNGEPLVSVPDAFRLWGCRCGQWHTSETPVCSDCDTERPAVSPSGMEFEVAFRFDIPLTEEHIGDAAMERMRDLARAIPPEIWASFRVQARNVTYDRMHLTEPASQPSNQLPLPFDRGNDA